MAEFTLPANSIVKTGKSFSAPDGAKRTKRFKIYRWDPGTGATTAGPPLSPASEFDALVGSGEDLYGIAPDPGGGAPALLRVQRVSGAVTFVGTLPAGAGAVARAN